ncbi:MAG TPA: hypothetical protein VF189_01625 [Patescibacteria group bacterium]
MGSPDISLGLGQIRHLDSGHTITSRRLFKPEELTKAGRVSRHEIIHVAASKFRIKAVNIIPHGNTLGETHPDSLTLEGAGAPAGMDMDGCRYDLMIAALLFNASESQAKAAGRAAVVGLDAEIDLLSQFLEYRKDMGQSDVNEGLQMVSERRRGIYRTEVEVKGPDGKSKKYQTKSLNGEVMIPGKWVELGKVA